MRCQVFARRLQGAWEIQERGQSISGIGNGEPVIRYRMWKPALLVLRRVLLPLFLVWVLKDIVFWTPPTGGPAHVVSQFNGIWEVYGVSAVCYSMPQGAHAQVCRLSYSSTAAVNRTEASHALRSLLLGYKAKKCRLGFVVQASGVSIS